MAAHSNSQMAGDGASPGSAFAAWMPESLESLPCMPAAAAHPLPQLTVGLAALTASCRGSGSGGNESTGSEAKGGSLGGTRGAVAAAGHAAQPSAATAAEAAGGWTLPDGRLRLGTHLPLLAGRYRYLGLVGDGDSAQLVLAQDELRRGSQPVVLKIIRRHLAAAGQKEARALRFLAVVANPAAAARVLSLRSVFHFRGHHVLALERLHGSLLDYIVSVASDRLAVRLAGLRKIAHQLLTGVEALHACGIVHADLKPDNILMTQPPGGAGVGVKIADFGSCFAAAGVDTERLSFELQTLSYRAPEVVSGEFPVGPPADMWSLGCILAEVALQRPLFPVHTPAGLLRQVNSTLQPGNRPAAGRQARSSRQPRAVRGAAPAATAPAAGKLLVPQPGRLDGWHLAAPPLVRELAVLDRSLAHLVSQLLVIDPGRRATARQALQHPFLRSLTPLAAVARAEASDATAQARQDAAAAAAAAAAEGARGSAAAATAAEQSGQPVRPSPRRGLSLSPAADLLQPEAGKVGAADVAPGQLAGSVSAVQRLAADQRQQHKQQQQRQHRWQQEAGAASQRLPGLAHGLGAAPSAAGLPDPAAQQPAMRQPPAPSAVAAGWGEPPQPAAADAAAFGVPRIREVPPAQREQQLPGQHASQSAAVEDHLQQEWPMAASPLGLPQSPAADAQMAAAQTGADTAAAAADTPQQQHSSGTNASLPVDHEEDPAGTWQRLGDLIDEVSPDKLSPIANLTIGTDTPQQEQPSQQQPPVPQQSQHLQIRLDSQQPPAVASGSGGDRGGDGSSRQACAFAMPRPAAKAESAAQPAAEAGGAAAPLQRHGAASGVAEHSGANSGADSGADSDETATAAHSAAVAALAALASSTPLQRPLQRQRLQRPGQSSQQQQQLQHQQKGQQMPRRQSASGSRKRKKQPDAQTPEPQPAADAVAPTARSAVKNKQPAAQKRPRASAARDHRATTKVLPPARPSPSGTAGSSRPGKQPAAKAVGKPAGEQEVQHSAADGTPQRSLRDRHAVSDKKPWWQV